MMSLVKFITEVNQRIGIVLPSSWPKEDEIEIARRFIEKVNEYFFQTYPGIGITHALDDEEFQYFSEFHKFWETHHQEILNVRFSRSQVAATARHLHLATETYSSSILELEMVKQVCGLAPQAVAQVRFFTANQDWREPPENPWVKYLEDPAIYEPLEIRDDPSTFLRELGVTRLSQSDKRLDFARNAARFLVEQQMTAYDLAKLCSYDAAQIRDTLVAQPNMGYGPKKANMLIRDMYVLQVWPNLTNLEAIDVASDINTMKLALRTHILQTNIPLVSSLLDIFCYQYEYISIASASAWRLVWRRWREENPETAPASPCLMDFLLYRIGRDYCNDLAVLYQCQDNSSHCFWHFGGRLRRCRFCRSEVKRVEALLPCQVPKQQLPRQANGQLMLNEQNLLFKFGGVCIFKPVCKPRSAMFKKLSPPMSISIKGRTGWTQSYSYRDQGGGGMMA
jgi:hypothetical protein